MMTCYCRDLPIFHGYGVSWLQMMINASVYSGVVLPPAALCKTTNFLLSITLSGRRKTQSLFGGFLGILSKYFSSYGAILTICCFGFPLYFLSSFFFVQFSRFSQYKLTAATVNLTHLVESFELFLFQLNFYICLRCSLQWWWARGRTSEGLL